jgi:enoyl-CoA hydratase
MGEFVRVEAAQGEASGAVAVIRLERPPMNALNAAVQGEIADAAAQVSADPQVRAVIVYGGERVFAAGADIKEMASKSYADVFTEDFITANWERVTRCRKPVIAAVAGYALGGGCELAMMCDFIIAADNARFGQPEITLGVMPGMGGSQRLTRAVGKAKAMDMCLTGRMMDAAEAERSGLVSRVVPAAGLLDEALSAAAKIADFSLPSVMMAKEAVNRAFETTLAEGLRFEKRLFHSMFALDDQTEGMSAFVEKRKANFTNR